MGKRQHYIPRMLLKGFASKSDPENAKFWIWQVRPSHPPIEISTKDAAVEKNFYGGDQALESRLSEFESANSKVVEQLLAGEEPNNLSSQIELFVWSQAVRTKAIRDEFISAAIHLLETTARSIYSSTFKESVSARVHADFETLIAENSSNLPLIQRITLEELVKVPDARNLILDSLVAQASIENVQRLLVATIHGVINSGILREKANAGFYKGLESMLKMTSSSERYRPEFWELTRFKEHSILLGDICTFAISADGSFGSIPKVGEGWQTLVLPVAHNAVLLGHRSTERSIITTDLLNLASSSLSTDKYYCSSDSDQLTAYNNKIGSVEPLVAQHEIETMVIKAIKI